MNFLILFISIVFNSSSGILLKYSSYFESPKKYYIIAMGFVCASISAILYTKALESIPIGTATSIASGLVVLACSFAGIFLFNENYSIFKIIGTFMVCLGIILISK